MKTRPAARERASQLGAELRAVRERLHELHRRAGIADAVENLALPSGMSALDDPPFGTEAARRAREADLGYENDRFVRGLRRLYFGVGDPGLRRELIQLSRLFEEKNLAEAWARVDAAHGDLAEAKKPPNWPLAAAATGVVAVWLGFQLAGVAGAIGGAVVAFFLGKGIEADATARQRAAIASAEEVLKSEQETAQAVADRGRIFSGTEAAGGSPLAHEAGWETG